MVAASLKKQSSTYLMNRANTSRNHRSAKKGTAMLARKYVISLMTLGTLYGVLATIMIVTA